MKLVSVIVPMYNEAEMADTFLTTISGITQSIKKTKKHIDFEIIAVNDGSSDATYDILKKWYDSSDNLALLSLSRNFGQEAAIFAALEKAKGDAAIIIDCDMQDPPQAIFQMIEKWEEGADVVNAQRKKRSSDGRFKRKSAGCYYKLLNKLSDKVHYPHNVNNFRLLSRRVLDVVLSMPEKNKFLRGLIPYAGFKTETVEIVRQKRQKGKSKYDIKAMVRLGFNGIASTTTKPLIWAAYAGIMLCLLALLGTVALITLFSFGILADYTLWGVICGLGFFSGIILLFLGIMGFYIGKAFEEIKARPLSITAEYLPVKKISYD
ncbi:MAG: glycosyltransferase family 2 protein [Clostridia bacterium]|nr:glycosyltransferase family 2 protein [Clostridia bacterium]